MNPEYAAAVPHVRIHPQLVSFPFNLLTEKTYTIFKNYGQIPEELKKVVRGRKVPGDLGG